MGANALLPLYSAHSLLLRKEMDRTVMIKINDCRILIRKASTASQLSW